MSNNVLGPISVLISRIEVLEDHDVDTNLEPEHVGWKSRWIEVVNEFKRKYVLLIYTVVALVDFLNAMKLIYHGGVHYLCSIICGCDDGSACQPVMVFVVGIKFMESKVVKVGHP